MAHSTLLLWLSFLSSFAGLGGAAPQPAQLVVQTSSGRQFQGDLDPRSDPDRLWLRYASRGVVLRRPIAWDQIAGIQRSGVWHDPVEFRRRISAKRSHLVSAARQRQNEESELPQLSQPIDVELVPPPAESLFRLEQWNPLPLPVRSIHADVYVANWDAGVEIDGLVVHLYALADDGAVIPVEGTLEATLVGRRLASRQHTEQFPEIGQWTRYVRPEHLGPAGAVYRLEFQAAHPDFDFTLGAQGALHLRLVVPGQGTLETTAAMVRIRPYSSLRDQLQMRERTRFFNVERPGRTH
jgi:hypothetical protein